MKTLSIAVGLLVVAAAIITVLESGTTSRYLVDPGPLSQPHAFLEDRCDACHTPIKGVEAASCIVCHADDEDLLQREPTAFHANISSCTQCHPEHGGRIRRAIAMDHAALSRIGIRESEDSAAKAFFRDAGFARSLDAGRAGADHSRLDCAACHAKEDPHRGQFGLDCADCHGTERWAIAGYQHPSPRSRDCAQCHLAPPCHNTR